ncbi:DJ-1/PfpI family protein [Actinomadura rupiterrae]|uniref:DJ-1/PfpI family protein n=1 Tax=Actinomadura rupiterrae TaxID=559627 RepID=UPI0020A2C11C|nr:DJ-1/PfpI family protein [Actinomadura rupiterrae]MCP2343035.1 transcriptional regulator GlxA family with amidase domain [Actinomadura rupiterrae]
MTTYGLLLFEGAEELDFAGPWEIFTASSMTRDGADRAVLISKSDGPVRCNKGMRVLPDHTFDDHPELDVLLVPGGNGRVAAGQDKVITDWVAATAPTVQWVTSVCTGSLLLHDSGLLRGKRATTHWAAEDELEAREGVTLVQDERFVVDGNVVTSQGVSAGIDMALWLIGRLHGVDHARGVQKYVQYYPEPPYQS